MEEQEELTSLPIIKPINTDLQLAAKQQFDYFLVLDFEATCDNKGWKNPEIIEFPTVLWNAKTMEIEDEFHHYIRPTLNPLLTPFCTELTGIQQDWVDKGLTLKQALEAYDKWMVSKGLISYDSSNKITINKPFGIVTCGNWDLFQMLSGQCKREKIERANYFRKWINIKEEFLGFYQMKNLLGMAGMLKVLDIPLTGKHHSGIDDCRNITKILKRMIMDGCILKFTGNTEKPEPIETKPQVVDSTENVELVAKLVDVAMKELTIQLVKDVLSGFTTTSTSEINKIKGMITKKVLDKVKEVSPVDNGNMKAVDKKSFTSKVTDKVNKFVEEHQLLQNK